MKDDGGGVRGGAAAVRALLPLRLFLGITFVYAGLDKLSSPSFLDPSSPTSMLAQMTAVPGASPLGFLVDWAAKAPTATGLLMAFGELAVGLGTLFGLFARVAAAGGALISLSLWLTVSWSATPYYLGNDLAYLMGWIPLALAGAPVLSLDAWRGARARRAAGDAAPAASGASRRALVDGGAAAAGVAVLGALSGGLAHWLGGSRKAAAGRRHGAGAPSAAPSGSGDVQAPSVGPSGSAGARAAGPEVAVAQVPVGGAVRVTDPSQDGAVFVLQPKKGEYRALSAVCTHAGCEVAPPARGELVCPCHGSRFDAATGKVLHGPADKPLQGFPVTRDGDRLRVEL